MPQVSFAADIKPLFRDVDVSHMKSFGAELDDYTYRSNPNNANSVLATVSPHNGELPSMTPDEPNWTEAQLELFVLTSQRGKSARWVLWEPEKGDCLRPPPVGAR
ncbi:hypothetical protein H7849_20465 [Alloacidobacterium dinghuense]|uniref:Uncharacterized protein n=1 Tax=Alloacidobacterium dinghuense TaxID=2763107 RepID=A0A7G8BFV6_9BACT|nr:hypothetical protein [Alloacidobacterium dinghuense]QNI31426.1 hypothetical protein H7849_20465 [Alloacidobacterium dinghuense]